jgi:hypothetical protein
MNSDAAAVNMAPRIPPTTPAPITTPVECWRWALAGGAAAFGGGAAGPSVLVVVCSEVMWLLVSLVGR